MSATPSDRGCLFLGLAYQQGELSPAQLLEGVSNWLTDRVVDVRADALLNGWVDEATVDRIDGWVAELSGVVDAEQTRPPSLATDTPCGELARLLLTVADGADHAQTIKDGLLQAQREMADRGEEVSDSEYESQTLVPAADDTATESATIVPASDAAADGGGGDTTLALGAQTRLGGRFQIIRPFAKGGLGQVSIARDIELNREVALKELQAHHADNANLVERFQMEAEITGRLEHPGVVPVYGRGQHDNGAGYYVMRFVRGEELKDAVVDFHAAHRGLLVGGQARVPFMQLLRQFVDVCYTIGYAHSRGIIHRDLKPSNIMLGKFGETFVVDWGLAKPVDQREAFATEGPISVDSLSGSGSQATQMGSTVGTPEFMSPEQADGRIQEIDARSDIYCLGATLYFILTKQPPASGNNLYEIVERVSAGKIRTTREVNGAVPRALNAICMKALARKSIDRYESVGDLAADIERWMADEPVSVVADSLVDRARRWFRHHRSLALVSLASLVLLAGVTTVASLFINQARIAESEQRGLAEKTAERNLNLARSEKQARETAEKNRREALVNFKQARSAVDTALTGISEILGDLPGLQQARVQLLERVADNYLRFALQKSEDLEIQIESGRAFLRLGEVRQALYEMEAADDSFRQGEERFRRMLKQHPENITIALELAACLSKRAILNDIQGDYDDAQAFYDEVVLRLRTLVAQPDQQDASRKALAAALSNLANMQLILDKLRLAESASLESSAIYEQLRQDHPDDPTYAVGVAQQHYNLGLIKNQTNRVAAAGTDFQQSIDIFTGLLQTKPGNSRYLQSRAALSNALALAMRTQGKIKAEQAAYRVAEQDYGRLIEARPDDPSLRKNLALTQNNQAQTLNRVGQSAEAVQILLPAYRILDALYEQFVAVPEYGEQLGICCGVLAHAHMLGDDRLQARRFSDLAIERFQELAEINPAIGMYRQRLALAQGRAAELLSREKDYKTALEQVGRAIQSMQTLVAEFPKIGSYRDSLANLLATRSRILAESGQQGLVKEARQEAVTAWEETIKLEPNPLYQYHVARFQAEVLNQLNDEETAVLLVWATACTELTPFSADSQNLLALAKVLNGVVDDAQQALEQARKLRTVPHADDDVVEALVLASQGSADEAKEALQKARQWLASQQPGNYRIRDMIAEVERYLARPR
ncbi:MAG: protein kinase [Pirellulaceae bacterium]